ncbi:MAG: cobalt-precorrin-5B (C(1))-methyltransferase [Campylobacterota bacterium]|nr:cobalt-precorrin-5B (C(1))-methyltransferase [Campylobacterota bacterium]
MSTKLRKGYTTGVHTSFAFKSALQTFLATRLLSISKTFKMDNDDFDVTKGCEIIVSISNNIDDLEINNIQHNPYILDFNNSTLELYAGIGVGVVTKDGLKPPKGYPAINPKPLEVLQNIFNFLVPKNQKLFCTVSVTNGENIAKHTANSKVGVMAGISILGTTGFVKPISATAYIDSIEQELNFASSNSFNTIIFTLGNTAHMKASDKANKLDTNSYIIEIGNFIYDGIKLAVELKFKNIELWLGIGKTVKIAQGFKNTHNRFGGIDFKDVQNWVDIDIKECLTIKGVRELLGDKCEKFDTMAKEKTKEQLHRWFKKDIEVKIC